MNNLMNVSVKYTKQLDNGSLKRVREEYLLNADSFTDAEAKIHEELGQIIRGEFTVLAMKRSKYIDILSFEESGFFYKAVAKIESLDCDSEKVKKYTESYLVEANSVESATKFLESMFEDHNIQGEISSTALTKIVEVFS